MDCCQPRRRLLLLPVALPLALACGCTTRMGADGRKETVVDPKYLAKGDIDRVIDAARRETVEGLLRFTEKLYRRNPRELKLGPSPTIEAALKRLRRLRVSRLKMVTPKITPGTNSVQPGTFSASANRSVA